MTLHLQETQAGRMCTGPVVLVVMDGVACGPQAEDNAVYLADTPTLDRLQQGLWTELLAHGTHVGMPSDTDMGNSEVGHNALGAGRIFAQGAKLVDDSIHSGSLFEGSTWKETLKHCLEKNSTLHFIGLLSDGNVHSHERHLHAMLRRAAEAQIKRVCVHVLTDGRDVSERSALVHIERLEQLLEELSQEGRLYQIASGGGRMLVTMDRYEADWPMVQRGWELHVEGKGRAFSSATEAIQTYRDELGVNDQYLPGFVIHDSSGPVGPILDGDAVLFTHFRGDRAIELCQAFTSEDAPIQKTQRPDVLFAGMMQYDGDRQIPPRYLVEPPLIDRTMSEYLVGAKLRQFAISETQKYGHMTYFWNGNRTGTFDDALETYVEVHGDPQPFEERPWMKAAEITDQLIEAIESGAYDFVRANYPNGDMVGHTGSLEASKLAVSTVDLCLERLLQAVEKANGLALITADHGNADEMWERDKQGEFKRDAQGQPIPKTSHSLRPVPFTVFAPQHEQRLSWSPISQKKLSHVAATVLFLLGYETPEGYDPPLLTEG